MDIINNLLTFLLSLLDKLLPALNVDSAFLNMLDNAISVVLGFYYTASWFVPLDVAVACYTVMLVVDNWSFLLRIGQSILKLIRG